MLSQVVRHKQQAQSASAVWCVSNYVSENTVKSTCIVLSMHGTVYSTDHFQVAAEGEGRKGHAPRPSSWIIGSNSNLWRGGKGLGMGG